MKRLSILTIIIFSTFFYGCSTPERIDNTVLTNSIISMSDFTDQYELDVNNEAGGYLFSRAGVRLHVYPNIRYIRYNGRTIPINEAPFVTSGKLFLPISMIENLPANFQILKPSLPDVFVILDAGHGGEDTGAISGNVLEKDLALDMVRRIQRGLAINGIQSKLTRNGDYFLTLAQRSEIANSYPGAIFVSIHVNAETSGNAEGIETFYLSSKISDNQRASWAATEYDFNTANGLLNSEAELMTAMSISKKMRSQSRSLARSVQSNITNNLQEKNRGIKEANFAVLRESLFGPAILVETGFISNALTKQKLIRPKYRQAMADSITKGITNFIRAQ